MARGDIVVFDEFPEAVGEQVHDCPNDDWRVALITTMPAATQATPALTDFTEVSGPGYTAGGFDLAGITWDRTAADTFLKSSSTPTWAQTTSGAGNIAAALLYNNTDASKRAAAAWDLRTADSPPQNISLADGSLTLNFNASGMVRFRRV
jgi:hypothetical protein